MCVRPQIESPVQEGKKEMKGGEEEEGVQREGAEMQKEGEGEERERNILLSSRKNS